MTLPLASPKGVNDGMGRDNTFPKQWINGGVTLRRQLKLEHGLIGYIEIAKAAGIRRGSGICHVRHFRLSSYLSSSNSFLQQ